MASSYENIYWDKRKILLLRKRLNCHKICLEHQLKLVDIMQCENSLLGNLRLYKKDIVLVPTASILQGIEYCRTLAKTIPTN